MSLDPKTLRAVLKVQENELTEHHIYRRLAKRVVAAENRKVLEAIAEDELRHSRQWQEYTGRRVSPNRIKVGLYLLLSCVFGFTFGVKLMERGEENAEASYQRLAEYLPQAQAIFVEEEAHEQALLQMLDEERLRYIGSIVLGLNDALVELTGALAGLTLALQNGPLIALTGSITGIAAALSMAASEYLSTKAEGDDKAPVRASIYTGVAYLGTVTLLILPYLVLDNYYISLVWTLAQAVLIIAFFNYYVSVAKDTTFRRPFLEMAGLSLGVALFSFGVGFVLRAFFGIDV
jgi:VIT1/CCC1 family predicted Fe2+/Mn2+ transporter